MTFLYPGFLWALGVLIIPVLIHLFNLRRYKKVMFTNVRFLKELQKQTRSARTLRQWLVLLSRMLALAFLVFAFAQPYIPVDGDENNIRGHVVIIYIDNSFSMEAESERGPSIEVAKLRADEIIKNFSETDRFCILTNDFTTSTRLVNRDQALSQVGEIESGPESRDMDELSGRIGSVLTHVDTSKKASVFLLSDFQFVQKGMTQQPADTFSSYYLLPIRARVLRNMGIDSMYFADPMVKLNEAVRMNVKVFNHGVQDREGVNISLKLDGELKSTTSLDVPANSSVTTGFDMVIREGGWKEAQVALIDEPVVFDDVFYFSFPVKEKVHILDLYEEEANKDLGRIYGNDPYYQLDAVKTTSMDYAAISGYDLVILDHLTSISSGLVKVLEAYVNAGGSLVMFPSVDGLAGLNTLANAVNAPVFGGLETRQMDVAFIDYEHELFDNVFEEVSTNIDLPALNRYYRINPRPGTASLIRLRNNQPFLTVTQYGKGSVYQFAVSLDRQFGNLPDHAILVPVMLKMSLQSSIRYPLWYTIGEMKPMRVDDHHRPSESGLQLVKGDYRIVPERIPDRNETLIAENGQVQEAGNYQLLQEEKNIQRMSFNYDRKESVTDLPDEEELHEIFSRKNFRILDAVGTNIGQQLKNEKLGKRFWASCLLLSLFFILIEILLLRLWPLRVKSKPK